jgi:hypothetical protein
MLLALPLAALMALAWAICWANDRRRARHAAAAPAWHDDETSPLEP